MHFSQKNLTSGGNNFNDFPGNQLPKFHQIGMAAAIAAIPLPEQLRITCVCVDNTCLLFFSSACKPATFVYWRHLYIYTCMHIYLNRATSPMAQEKKQTDIEDRQTDGRTEHSSLL